MQQSWNKWARIQNFTKPVLGIGRNPENALRPEDKSYKQEDNKLDGNQQATYNNQERRYERESVEL